MCDDIASHLREKGVKAAGYHRGIRAGILEKTMKGWIGGAGVREADRVDVVCATSEACSCSSFGQIRKALS